MRSVPTPRRSGAGGVGPWLGDGHESIVAQASREGSPAAAFGPRAGRAAAGPVRGRHGEGSMGTLATCRGFPCGAWAAGGRHEGHAKSRNFFRRAPGPREEGRRRMGVQDVHTLFHIFRKVRAIRAGPSNPMSRIEFSGTLSPSGGEPPVPPPSPRDLTPHVLLELPAGDLERRQNEPTRSSPERYTALRLSDAGT